MQEELASHPPEEHAHGQEDAAALPATGEAVEREEPGCCPEDRHRERGAGGGGEPAVEYAGPAGRSAGRDRPRGRVQEPAHTC